jgi:hypothetical protein
MANNFMKTAPAGVVYGTKRKKAKRWYPERRKPGPSRAGIEMAAQSKDKTMCESEALDIHKIRKAFDLPCKDCKYKDTKYCRWM